MRCNLSLSFSLHRTTALKDAAPQKALKSERITMEIFTYAFMQKAFIAAFFIAIITPLIGNVMVLKGLSNLGEALSHTTLSGLALGLMLGIDPLIGAIVLALLGALSIEVLRRAFAGFEEIATTVILSFGIGLASIFSGFLTNPSALNNFLFGSIVAIESLELYLIIGLSAVVVAVFLALYRQLFAISFDEEYARLQGVRVNLLNFVFMLLTAVTIALASRTVGALIVSSLIVIPVACGMKVGSSYRTTTLWSVVFALLFTFSGLFISFYLDLRPGGTIVIIGVFVLLIITGLRRR